MPPLVFLLLLSLVSIIPSLSVPAQGQTDHSLDLLKTNPPDTVKVALYLKLHLKEQNADTAKSKAYLQH